MGPGSRQLFAFDDVSGRSVRDEIEGGMCVRAFVPICLIWVLPWWRNSTSLVKPRVSSDVS